MTTAALPAPIAPSQRDWRSLLWTVPVTLLWMVLIYRLPQIPASGIPISIVRMTIFGLIAVGLWIALERTNLSDVQRRTTWLAVIVPFMLWGAIVWSAAIAGALRSDASALPLLPLAIFVPIIIGAPPLLFSKRLGLVLDAMPASWLVGLQTYRILGSIILIAGLRGALAPLFAFPAGIGDVLTGLFALPAAMAVASGSSQGRSRAVLWNIFGLADLAIAITLGMITSAGPFQLVISNVPSVGVGSYPDVLTPAFAVPSSILLHMVSLRQLSRRASA